MAENFTVPNTSSVLERERPVSGGCDAHTGSLPSLSHKEASRLLTVTNHSSTSWFDAIGSRRKAFAVSAALQEEMTDRSFLFLTLTYKRDEYDGPEKLWRAAKEKRHFSRFIDRLERRLGRNLRGKWFAKIEFQEGGWLHWHVVLESKERIENSVLREVWGHGFVNVRKMTKIGARYVCKYVSKGSTIPDFLLDERARSIKITRTSPGFWRFSRPPRTKQPPLFRRCVSLYRPVRAVVHTCAHRCRIRHRDKAIVLQYPPDQILRRLFRCGAELVGFPRHGRGMVVRASGVPWREVQQWAASGEAAAALNLILQPVPPRQRFGLLSDAPIGGS